MGNSEAIFSLLTNKGSILFNVRELLIKIEFVEYNWLSTNDEKIVDVQQEIVVGVRNISYLKSFHRLDHFRKLYSSKK